MQMQEKEWKINQVRLQDDLCLSFIQKCREDRRLEIILHHCPAIKAMEQEADNNRPQCCACSLSLPRGKPIDLQFILTSVKSMQRDMKSPQIFTTSVKDSWNAL